ncbi:hypothetical protein DUI87_01267 [Hirundo rustica rustica]|uniref:Retroviral nucleocapsid Gag protein p24 C-terminal domain-containing protein n=1 Tax=Hirundo rustica rustica TaxID=333673 RepID=A0A3M0LMV3_HIRRU|nr:hypothetical protein DUI87_01267 [Hirundo rustica rustica]
MGIGNLLLVPEADYNLLGRDLIIEMGINIEVVNEEIKIKLCPLRVEDEEKINSEVWYTPDSVGRLNIPPFSVIIKDPKTPIRVKQYPISPEGKNGLKPEIERLLSKGLLESCMSPFNTPILPIKRQMDHTGNTALHDCAESGSLEIMKMLLKYCAKMEKDGFGMIPLLSASVTGHTNIVDFLTQHEQTNTGNFKQCINLWKYALDIQQRNLDPLGPMTASSLLSFAELFSFILQDKAKGLLGTIIAFDDLMEHLCGDDEWVSALKQAQEIPLAVLERIKDAASKAFSSIQPNGSFQPCRKIKQLPSEPFIKLVERLTRAIELQVKEEGAQEQVLEEMALANANEECKAAILSLLMELAPTLDDMLQVCARKVPFMTAHQSHSSRDAFKPLQRAAAADTVPPVP